MVVVRPPWHELSRGPIPLQEGFIPAVTAHRDVIPAVRRISDATWQASARCRASATDMFFPQRTRTWGERIRLEQAAKKICERCPVLVECRTYALEHEERHGVWGGLTESERRSRFATGRSATQKQNHRSTISTRDERGARPWTPTTTTSSRSQCGGSRTVAPGGRTSS
ncbi:hypothetical protein GS467_09545 [Rhodococcus hoagii]|nr:hypothetical protein [Prescottella equi]NKR46906.1 hypothetical protein [Prescottella equi]NKS21448.1 hypothetical protein [Prescottella equi]NKZ78096.1 hypothetical protein [Prescottella equi]